MDFIQQTLQRIQPVDATLMDKAQKRLDNKTKPPAHWAGWRSSRAAWPPSAAPRSPICRRR